MGRYHRLGTTIDDALGEAFDKVAKLLGLGYPGGPQVEAHARRGNPQRFDFPRPLKGRKDCNFSFSGLKTAVREAVNDLGTLSDQDVADVCASFEAAVAETMADRLTMAVHLFRAAHPDVETPGADRGGRRCRQPEAQGGVRAGGGAPRPQPHRAAAEALHRQCGDDRLGRGGAAGAGPRR